MKRLMCSLFCLLVMGCGTAPTPAMYDGNWKLTDLGGQGIACISIQGGAIVGWNDGCDGSYPVITDSQVGALSGDTIVWVLRLTWPNVGSGVFTYNLTDQHDGTLRGTGVVNVNGQPGQLHSVLMTPN